MLLIELAAIRKVLKISLFAKFFRHLRHAPVGQRIFQALGHGFVGSFGVEGQIAVLFQVFHATFVEHGRGLHGFEGFIFPIS